MSLDSVDLFQKAEENAENIVMQYQQAQQSLQNVANFVSYVQASARASINRGQSAIKAFLKEGVLLNAFQVAARQSTEIQDFLKQNGWPPIFIDRRIQLAQSVCGGYDMLYGALNTAGAGTVGVNGTYGFYCIVLAPSVFSNNNTKAACCRSDMLCPPYWNGRDIQWDEFFRALAPYTHQHLLAGIKYLSQLKESSQDQWPLIILGIGKRLIGVISGERRYGDDYIEVFFIASVDAEDIEIIRFHDDLWYLINLSLAEEDGEQRKIMGYTEEDHIEIVELLKERNIRYI